MVTGRYYESIDQHALAHGIGYVWIGCIGGKAAQPVKGTCWSAMRVENIDESIGSEVRIERDAIDAALTASLNGE